MPTRRRRDYYVGAVERLREARGGACEAARLQLGACRRTAGLEFAHLKPTRVYGRGRGRCQRYHDIKNHPESYALLCRHHHSIQELRMATKRIAARPVFREREPGEDDDR